MNSVQSKANHVGIITNTSILFQQVIILQRWCSEEISKLEPIEEKKKIQQNVDHFLKMSIYSYNFTTMCVKHGTQFVRVPPLILDGHISTQRTLLYWWHTKLTTMLVSQNIESGALCCSILENNVYNQQNRERWGLSREK